jgi:eukaryotic-like serine/threonine-protein kinase
VYEAEGPEGARFAVKILDAVWARDPEAAGRFAREGRAASDIRSPHIVRVVDGGTEGGSPYLVMELLEGEDLARRLRARRRLGLDEALSLVEQTLAGLVAAHAAGIVHRDLKPENLFLSPAPDGEGDLVKIVDFGMSKRERPAGSTKPLPLTRRGKALGTPLYMSPEQARAAADVDARSDLFAVGAILFECLTGRPPFVGETYEQILLKICMEDAPDVRRWAPEVPDALAALVSKALERERERRYASADAMLAAVRAIGTVGAGDEARLRRRARARMIVAATIAVLAGALVTLAAVALVGK